MIHQSLIYLFPKHSIEHLEPPHLKFICIIIFFPVPLSLRPYVTLPLSLTLPISPSFVLSPCPLSLPFSPSHPIFHQPLLILNLSTNQPPTTHPSSIPRPSPTLSLSHPIPPASYPSLTLPLSHPIPLSLCPSLTLLPSHHILI